MHDWFFCEDEDTLEKYKNMRKLLKDIHAYKREAWDRAEGARTRAKELSIKFPDVKYYVSYPTWFVEDEVRAWYKKEFNEEYYGHVCSEKSYPSVPENNILLAVYKNGEIIENWVNR